ncbi:MAG TPA: GNAT family N-acetyltransferase [Vicinamibacterales bacterium]|jgi:GNAT superfamily N-acetyltransferase|nr:GNAT family N-acetyltransferase [Vicinamibacterales bacterium]
MAVQIRRAALADAARMADLSGVLGYPVERQTMEERLAHLLARDDNAVFVALDGGRIAGWIHGAEHELLEVGRLCEILGLVVDASARRGGAGRALVAALEQFAASRGLRQVSVRTNVVRVESHPFYERLGYTRVKTQHSYRKHLEV